MRPLRKLLVIQKINKIYYFCYHYSMNPLWIVLCIIFISTSYSEFCPDCGLKIRQDQKNCNQCDFSLKPLWGWWEAQKRSIPGLHILKGVHQCPHCQKIHKKRHFFCFHCGKVLLKRVGKEGKPVAVDHNKGFSASNGGLRELLEKAGRDPGSLTGDQKASLVNWVKQKPLSVLFKASGSEPGGRKPPLPASGLLKQFRNIEGTRKPVVPDFMLQQLKGMQDRW